MKVYIYKPKGTEFADDWLYSAYQGFTELGADIRYFEDINEIPYAPDHVVVAYIEDTRAYFDMHGINYPKPLNIPKSLNKISTTGRRILHCDLARAKTLQDESIFIKPADQTKQFPAGVIPTVKLQYLLDIPDDTQVMVSTVVDFISEWRCFVHNFTIEGLVNYHRKFHIFPDIDRIVNMISIYHTSKEDPVAYSLDVGVVLDTDGNKQTYIIECNDFWSIGNYGFNSLKYAKMLRDRWFQLTGYRTFKNEGKDEPE